MSAANDRLSSAAALSPASLMLGRIRIKNGADFVSCINVYLSD